jgi:hypothetical protein
MGMQMSSELRMAKINIMLAREIATKGLSSLLLT